MLWAHTHCRPQGWPRRLCFDGKWRALGLLVDRSSRERPQASVLGFLESLSVLQMISLLSLNVGLREGIDLSIVNRRALPKPGCKGNSKGF